MFSVVPQPWAELSRAAQEPQTAFQCLEVPSKFRYPRIWGAGEAGHCHPRPWWPCCGSWSLYYPLTSFLQGEFSHFCFAHQKSKGSPPCLHTGTGAVEETAPSGRTDAWPAIWQPLLLYRKQLQGSPRLFLMAKLPKGTWFLQVGVISYASPASHPET